MEIMEKREFALNALNRLERPPEAVYKLRWAIRKGIYRIKQKYAVPYRDGVLVHDDLNELLELIKN